jgi:Domain of unknown function (DUF4203)
MAPVHIVAGLILLILGRQLFWVFVAVLGFVVGMDLATQLLPGGGHLVVLAVALGAGVLGAVLARSFYSLAMAVAGFLAGGRIGIALLAMWAPSSAPVTWLVFAVAGAIGAVLLLIVFDWALIVLSSLLGAGLIVPQLPTSPQTSALLLVALVIAGIAIQAGMLRRRPAA